MIGSAASVSDSASARALLEPSFVEHLLADHLPLDWPEKPNDVRIERCWPDGPDGCMFEWSFALEPDNRYVLFAKRPASTPGSSQDIQSPTENRQPRITASGLRNVLVHIPAVDITVHSPDCDPVMPHLSKCLDEASIADHLALFWDASDQRCMGFPRAACYTLMGYKPARRATLAYQPSGVSQGTQKLVGKTFRNGQAQRLLSLHGRLNDELCGRSGGSVRVATPIGYVPDVRMAVFAWARGEGVDSYSQMSPEKLTGAVDALAALHGVYLDDLPVFTIEDECRVLNKWHGLLGRLLPDVATRTEKLRQELMDISATISPTRICTIHRDFYEAQLVSTRRTTTILDLDTLALGDPCLDLGNFLAHLFLQLLRNSDSGASFADLRDTVIERYKEHFGHLHARALEFYLASSLFRLGAVHAFRTATHRFADSMWQLAESVMDSSGISGQSIKAAASSRMIS